MLSSVNRFMAVAGSVIRPMLALISVLLVLVTPVSAFAQTAIYNLEGIFNAPETGSFSGSYVVNRAANTIMSVNISVTAGLASNGVAVPANDYRYAGYQNTNVVTFATSTPATGQRGGGFFVDGTMATPTS